MKPIKYKSFTIRLHKAYDVAKACRTKIMSEAYQFIEENLYPGAECASTPYSKEPEIANWRLLDRYQLDDVGEVETALVEMDDAARYIFRRITPNVLRSEISVDFSPPLATRVDGFNTYMAVKIAQAGLPVRIVGTDQTHHRTLDHAAKATHKILHHADSDDRCSPDESVLIGYSMGAMKGMGMLANAEHAGRNIRFMLGIDPCLANALDYTKYSPAKLATYFTRESLELGRILFDDLMHDSPLNFLKRSMRLMDTVNFSPQFALNFLDKWSMLASGETGKLAEQVPQDAAMVLHFFKGSLFNDHEEFKRILGSRPFVRFVLEDGYHLSGGDPHVVDNIVTKLSKCESLIKDRYGAKELVDEMSGPLLPRRPVLKVAA